MWCAERSSRRPALLAGLAVLALVGLAPHAVAQEQVVVDFGSPMTYLANEVDPGIGAAWIDPAFDDSGWSAGTYGVGYENGANGAQDLIRTEVPNTTVSIFTRSEFDVADAGAVQTMYLGVDFDDGVVVWLNGVEIFRSNSMPTGPIGWDPRPSSHESSNAASPSYETYNVSDPGLGALVDGTNVLAVGVYNTVRLSSDLVVAPRLALDTPIALTRGPYLQRGTDTEVVVRWRTNVPMDSRVDFGLDAADLSQSVIDPTLTSEHEVLVSGLSAQTEYFYAVGTSSEVLAGGSPDFSFVTAPVPGTATPTRIWVLGDSGTANQNAAAVRDAYYAYTGTQRTDLWLMLGDNAYPSGTDAEYQAAVFDMYPDMLRSCVLWPTIGNHDANSANSSTQSGVYYDIFTLPTAGEAGGVPSGTEAYYSFNWANIHFAVLDSEETDRTSDGPMMTWLAQDLAATAQDWVITFWHRPPYSKGSHDSDTELQLVEMRENAVPILDDYGVDLNLTGHSHDYERSYLIEGHYGDSTTFDESMKVDGGDGRVDGDGPYRKMTTGTAPHTGTVYTVAGSSGQTSGGTLDHPVMFISYNVLGSVVIDVDGGRLDAVFLGGDGTILDRYTVTKGSVTVPPVADFVSSPRVGVAPIQVDFIDMSRNEPTDWIWDFDNDGQIDSTSPSPVHDYPQPGIYSVMLEVSNAEGTDMLLRQDEICAVTADVPVVDGLAFSADRQTLTWNPAPAATAYDVIRGDLAQLRATGGDFASAQDACFADDVQDPMAVDPADPAPGSASFYLVRAADCSHRSGTFDATGSGQSGGRDIELQGQPTSCGCDALDDLDGDTLCDALDPCTDADGDGLGDPGYPASTCGIDNCPTVSNPTQDDFDIDGAGDACDPCTDGDGDGFADPGFPASTCGVDNCPLTSNPAQSDFDADGTGDICDACTDQDGDGLGDPGYAANTCPVDNCPADSNPGQLDSDTDSIGDVCDACPADPANDADADGVCGDVDNCPATANADQADLDADDSGDACDTCTDPDADGYATPGYPASVCAVDNCPNTFNFDQSDSDSDGAGDVCDTCPFDAADDADADGICGDVDNCPAVPNLDQGDLDGDTVGDVCDDCTDQDQDGFANPGFPASTCPIDNCPYKGNPNQSDVDGDGAGDLCDPCVLDPNDDEDGDSLCADVDNCPTVNNPLQQDGDADNIGDACDSCPADPANDVDGDSVCGDVDNCPVDTNPLQEDQDFDGAGNACDDDDDNDGEPDVSDCRPLLAGVSSAPDPIGPTLWMNKVGGGMLNWNRSAQGHLANVYRGQWVTGEPFDYMMTCFEDALRGTQVLDAATPPPGALYIYLISARNTCGESAAGQVPGGEPYYPPLGCPINDTDSDGDGIIDSADNCSMVANPLQIDFDHDFVGDACDNCMTKPNPEQADSNGNGVGDVCE